jgi:acyl carrier protein
MSDKEKLLEIIYKCAEELNRQLPEGRKLILKESTTVVGKDSSLDSLDIVMFTLNIEEQIRPLGISCNILEILTQYEKPPFVTIGEMATWLSSKRESIT